MASSDQPPQSSVGKPAAVLQNATEWLSSEQAAPSVENPDDRAAEIAKLEAMMQHIATQLAELKNTSSVSKPATTELDQSASMDPLPTTSVEKTWRRPATPAATSRERSCDRQQRPQRVRSSTDSQRLDGRCC